MTLVAYPDYNKRADLGDMWALQGRSTMHLACMRQMDECKVQCQIVEMLLDRSADVNAKDDMVCGACACSFHSHAVSIKPDVTLHLHPVKHIPFYAWYCTDFRQHLSVVYMWC